METLKLTKSFRYEIDEPVTLTRTNGDQTVTLPDDSLSTLNESPINTRGF